MYDRIWECADGRQVPVGQMETSHIVNCIRLIHRKSARGRRWRWEWLPGLELKLEIRNMEDRS